MCNLFYTDTLNHVTPGDAEPTDKFDTRFFTQQERDDMKCLNFMCKSVIYNYYLYIYN
jgi:hypothetical protein